MEDNKIVICPATAFVAGGAKNRSPWYKEPFSVVQRYGQAFVRQQAGGCLSAAKRWVVFRLRRQFQQNEQKLMR